VTSKLITIDHSVMSVERDADESRRFLEAVLERSLTGPVILFVGTLRAKHNLAAARWLVDVLAPQLDADVTLVLCGPGTESLHVPPGTAAPVACLGFVDDIDAIITATDLCLAPLASGGGVHTKVLHYLSHGKRVLGTPVAFEGIVAAPGVTRAPLAQFASRIRCVLAEPESPEQAAARSQLQRSWLEQHHGHAHIVQQLRDTMAGLAPSGQ
jgi:hypothetical protein